MKDSCSVSRGSGCWQLHNTPSIAACVQTPLQPAPILDNLSHNLCVRLCVFATHTYTRRSMLSSKESLDSAGSPKWVSINFDVPAMQQQQGKAIAATTSGDTAHSTKDGGSNALGSPLAAAGKRRSSGGGVQARLSSNADASSLDSATAGGGAGAGAGHADSGCPHGWLWHCANPVKVLSCQEAPLLCSAWTKGPGLPKLVVGSAAGWLVVVDCEGEEMEESMVSKTASFFKKGGHVLLWCVHARSCMHTVAGAGRELNCCQRPCTSGALQPQRSATSQVTNSCAAWLVVTSCFHATAESLPDPQLRGQRSRLRCRWRHHCVRRL